MAFTLNSFLGNLGSARALLYSNLLSPQKHINSDWVRAWITIMLSTKKVRIRGNRNILPQQAIKAGT